MTEEKSNPDDAKPEETSAVVSAGGADDAHREGAAATAQGDAEAEADAEADEEAAASPVLKNLLILPPLQKTPTTNGKELDHAVSLPPIRAEEPVSSIRAALSEVCGYAHLTNYRFVLEEPKSKAEGAAGTTGETPAIPPVISPFTGQDAQIAVPIALDSMGREPTGEGKEEPGEEDHSLVLDDYGDLTPLLEKGLQDGSTFRVVLERYDVALVRDHVMRLRSLLDGNAPSTTSLDDSGEATTTTTKDSQQTDADAETEEDNKNNANGKSEGEKKEDKQTKANASTNAAANGESVSANGTSNKPKESPADDNGNNKSPKEKEEDGSKEPTAPKDIPSFPAEKDVAPDVKNLKDFFYLSCGEDPALYRDVGSGAAGSAGVATDSTIAKKENGSKNKKKGKKGKQQQQQQQTSKDEEEKEGGQTLPVEQMMRETIPHLNQLEEKTRINCSIRFSAFHPPPPFRRLMGDLAYLEFTPQSGEDGGDSQTIHITAVPTGFFVNRSSTANASSGQKKKQAHVFDPSPAAKPCFSHDLLDCLLQCSQSFHSDWKDALEASKNRAELMAKLNQDGPFSSLFRVAVRGDFSGYHRPTTASAAEGIDALIQNPSWLVPISRIESGESPSAPEDAWSRNFTHTINPARMEDDLSNSFGVDLRTGTVRDWNEELQGAREMPVASLQERIERARVLNKVLTDFGEAAVLGVKAICDGQIAPMNPNEPTRSQVYLHNNIFFSRAVDAGVETFKIAKGDKAARKSASRDVHCLGSLHRMERSGLYTLATVLVDYLGTRYVCQSILPGILSGEKTHTLLYGAVEAGSPLVWDKEMHELLEDTLGKGLMIASRPLPRNPLSDERAAEIAASRMNSPFYVEKKEDEAEKVHEANLSTTVDICAPIEAKGIRGSDQRKYVLDMTRLTPRDANFVPKADGGTGLWEEVYEADKSSSAKNVVAIPESLHDDEWSLAVLRPELITNYAQVLMAKYLREKKEKNENGETAAPKRQDEAGKESIEKTEGKKAEADANEGISSTPDQAEGEKKENKTTEEDGKEKKATDAASVDDNADAKKKKTLSEDDLTYLKSLRFNVNVFLPDIKTLEGIDDEAFREIQKDEEIARNAAKYLWEEAMPRLTREIREGSGHQMPHDGKGLTEFIHQHGVNCRYLGRLATLAQQEEEIDRSQIKDLTQGKLSKLNRRIMPKFWLELLECEMIARAAKHVLDRYLTESSRSIHFVPVQIVASFLCAIVSSGEETAAQTEHRMGKKSDSEPDEDDFVALSFFEAGGGTGNSIQPPIRGRQEVWDDIENEIARRFRYTLTLYNQQQSQQQNSSNNSSRVRYVSLLRRVCQRTGTRLAAREYDIGKKCLCNGMSGGGLTASYPISPLDIIDIVPLVKHAAAHGEGFTACGLSSSTSTMAGGGAVGAGAGSLPPLHISLPDARAALEAAHLHHSGRALSRALDLAQEACGLYQRVTETPAHPGVVRCIDLMATILFDAGEPSLAAANAIKALGLAVQIGGFDTPDLINAHLVIFQMQLTAGEVSKAVKHLRAAIYLMDLLAGPFHVELANAYHKMGTVYHGNNDLITALRFYKEAAAREPCDRLLEGMIAKSTAMVLGSLGEFKVAVEKEKHAFGLFSILLGEKHTLTQSSDQQLTNFMKAAVEHGNKMVEDLKKKKEEQAAEAIANEIEAEEAAEAERKKKKANKKKKNKK